MKKTLSIVLAAILFVFSTAPVTGVSAQANSFALEPEGRYQLYAYNAELISYTNLGYAYWSGQGVAQPELDAAVAAINGLPTLSKTDKTPAGNPEYGLMSVSQDGKYTKKQYFLYGDTLTVNGTGYRITAAQYNTLKAAMEKGTQSGGGAIPRWFVYMNPNRVTAITCTDEKGVMRGIQSDHTGTVAAYLRSIPVSKAKTYKPGSKDLDSMPFQAVYTFDNGVTYTVYVSDTADAKRDVTFYVESSDMSFACQYTADGYISSYVQTAQEAIRGNINPMSGVY